MGSSKPWACPSSGGPICSQSLIGSYGLVQNTAYFSSFPAQPSKDPSVCLGTEDLKSCHQSQVVPWQKGQLGFSTALPIHPPLTLLRKCVHPHFSFIVLFLYLKNQHNMTFKVQVDCTVQSLCKPRAQGNQMCHEGFIHKDRSYISVLLRRVLSARSFLKSSAEKAALPARWNRQREHLFGLCVEDVLYWLATVLGTSARDVSFARRDVTGISKGCKAFY